MRRAALLVLLAAAGCSQNKAGCQRGVYAMPEKPAAQWTSDDHNLAVYSCLRSSADRLAGSPDTADEVARATVENCRTAIFGKWVSLEKEGDARPSEDDLARQARETVLADVVEYRARGCPRVKA
jgi:hypothetical protein